MDVHDLRLLAQRLASGQMKADEFVEVVQEQTSTIEHVDLDFDRRDRCGFPEVVYAEGKSIDTLTAIFSRLQREPSPILATRVSAEQAAAIQSAFSNVKHNAVARTLRIGATAEQRGDVAIITAGTTDLPVADEARETLDWMGVSTTLVADVGVAGPHRLPSRLQEFQDADAIVCVAGMEGALPSIVGGYVPCPVIAVPTSVGYGANFAGVSALLSMLNSCASNVSVVNIDAGFKAGYVAGVIATRAHKS